VQLSAVRWWYRFKRLSFWHGRGQPHRTPRLVPPTLVSRGCIRPELVEECVVCVVHNGRMCRNIRPLHNFEPPASKGEVHDAALQYVRKIAGTSKPSKANEEAFNRAVNEIAHATQHLLEDLVSSAPPKNREVEAAKAKVRSANRFATA
jgi:hypothetical protein